MGREVVSAPVGVRGQGRPHPLEEHLVVQRCLRRAAHRADPFDPVGEDRPPVQRLLRPHRPAVGKGDPFDAEDLRKEPTLRVHVCPSG